MFAKLVLLWSIEKLVYFVDELCSFMELWCIYFASKMLPNARTEHLRNAHLFHNHILGANPPRVWEAKLYFVRNIFQFCSKEKTFSYNISQWWNTTEQRAVSNTCRHKKTYSYVIISINPNSNDWKWKFNAFMWS